MPIRRGYRKRAVRGRRRRGSSLPVGVRLIAAATSRAMKFDRRMQSISEAAQAMAAGPVLRARDRYDPGTAANNLYARRAKALTEGKGKYGVRSAVGGFMKKNKTAQMLYDAGMSRMSGGGMYTGQGAYDGPDTNGLISSKSTMDVVPLFEDDSDQGVVLSKREYVSEIYGPPLVHGQPAPFTIQSFPLNPGLEKTFPWLSQIAANYDEYTLDQLIFTFKSTTTESGNQVNGQVGTVIMATNYNAAAAPFTEKFTMMQYDKANSSRLTESLQHGVECDPALLSGSHGEYVRVNPVVSNQDLKTYDHGLFQIAIANCTSNLSNQSLGELWVSYTVTLRKPKFFTGKGLAISKDIFLSSPDGSETNTAVMGTAILRGQQNNIGVKITQTVSNTLLITFPAAFAGSVRISTNCDYLSVFQNAIEPYAVVSGNISLIPDIYGPSTAVGDAPQAQVYVRTAAAGASVPATLGWIAYAHMLVAIATNGVDNVVSILLPPESVGLVRQQTYVEVSEYNAGFSYAANNISSSLAPIWVNPSGVIVVP